MRLNIWYHVRAKPLAIWISTESSTLFANQLDRYIIIMWNGNLSCPIKLVKSKEQHPVVFSSSERDSHTASNQSISITLTKLETLQYAITITDLPHPQITFYNCCPTIIDVTNDPECEEPIRFAKNWDWQYKLMPNKISYLSFPQRQLRTLGAYNNDNRGATKVLYFVAATAKKSSTSCAIIE